MEVEGKRDLKIARVNSILNNSEAKIFMKFGEALGIKNLNKNQTVELIAEVQALFKEQKNLCVVFILEELDHYIDSSRQIMLYKILDMLGTA